MLFFNDTATTEIYALSLHDALPISDAVLRIGIGQLGDRQARGKPSVVVAAVHRIGAGSERLAGLAPVGRVAGVLDRKSTCLNSSHANISYAIVCLKKKKIISKSRSS